ncbi:hypothetical protein QBC47DRAFT_432500 [Echria macrotheca]|uniref:Uncharacterized protein n=1 Tax=Echria macrotheca TaxID=438768 RepID=A0AAJ0F3X7_9PEZI|nr:hypothetical protein QBC47DRAFT_432500 [Echria macrotheca]
MAYQHPKRHMPSAMPRPRSVPPRLKRTWSFGSNSSEPSEAGYVSDSELIESLRNLRGYKRRRLSETAAVSIFTAISGLTVHKPSFINRARLVYRRITLAIRDKTAGRTGPVPGPASVKPLALENGKALESAMPIGNNAITFPVVKEGHTKPQTQPQAEAVGEADAHNDRRRHPQHHSLAPAKGILRTMSPPQSSPQASYVRFEIAADGDVAATCIQTGEIHRRRNKPVMSENHKSQAKLRIELAPRDGVQPVYWVAPPPEQSDVQPWLRSPGPDDEFPDWDSTTTHVKHGDLPCSCLFSAIRGCRYQQKKDLAA